MVQVAGDQLTMDFYYTVLFRRDRRMWAFRRQAVSPVARVPQRTPKAHGRVPGFESWLPTVRVSLVECLSALLGPSWSS